MQVEVEVVVRVLGSKYSRLGQVYSAAPPLPHQRAVVDDSHHEGGLIIPRARTLKPGDVTGCRRCVFIHQSRFGLRNSSARSAAFKVKASSLFSRRVVGVLETLLGGASFQQALWSTVPREDVASRCAL